MTVTRAITKEHIGLLDIDAVERDEHYGLDEQFVRAIDDGMPQAGGAGLGLDKIVMILTGAERLSNVILFPMT